MLKEMLNSNESVQVVVRCRPINEKEKLMESFNVTKVDNSCKAIEIYDPKHKNLDHGKRFTFDATFDFNCTNKEIYEKSVKPLIKATLEGFNSTVFAYGQSGAGKTYTMEGCDCDKGIISRTFEDIFDNISRSQNMQYLVRMSYLEIYQDEINDLLSKSYKKCELRENENLGTYVTNLSSFVCKSAKQMENLLKVGKLKRAVGTTNINEKSSRSHAVLWITTEMRCIDSQESNIRVGKLNLVDLAGSERQKKTNALGKRLREASKINLSLTALGNVISALAANNEQFIPYRDSKLTRLLKDSLEGNSKTLMITNISPTSYNYDESLNTLRFASKARNVKNEPKLNENPVDALLRKYQEEIERLKRQLTEREARMHKAKRRTEFKLANSLEFSTSNNNDGAMKSQKVFIEEECGIAQDSLYEKKEKASTNENSFSDHKEVNNLLKLIKFMESKLLTGNIKINLLEHTHEQQKALLAQTNEIREIEQREEEVKKLIELNMETTEEMREDYTNLHQEIEEESKHLFKLCTELERIQNKIFDAKEEFNDDRRELETTKNELFKELKLNTLLIKNFIPKEDFGKFRARLMFDEDQDTWIKTESHKIICRPKSTNHFRKPETLYSLIAQRKVNHIYRCSRNQDSRKNTFRFKCENLLQLDLYQLPRTTKDYKIEIKSQSTLFLKFKSAIQEEEDISIDAGNCTYAKKALNLRRDKVLSTPCLQPSDLITPKPVYPKTRGLVPK